MTAGLELKTSLPVEPSKAPGGLAYQVIEPLFALTDAAIIVGSAVVAGMAYHSAVRDGASDASVQAGLGLVAGLSYCFIMHYCRMYGLPDLLRRERDYLRVVVSWALALLFLVVVVFLVKAGGEVSRGAVVCFAILAGVSLVGWRGAAKLKLRSGLVNATIRGRRVLVIGSPNELAPYERRDLLTRFGLEEVERIMLQLEDNGGLIKRLRAALDRALDRARAIGAEEIVIALPWANTSQLELALEQLRVSPLPVRLLPDRAILAILGRQHSAPLGTFTIEVQRAPLSRFECSAKRMLDLLVAAVSLVFLAPVMAVAAVAIKLETPGPVIFRQRRHGFNGQPFVIYKFRTMRVLEDGEAIVQAKRKDPRITRLGRLLRASSIDELPQLVNVLRGEMSMVGPRPHALAHDHEFGKMIANYAYRHHVKPGITGWAQVHGYRGETPRVELMERRVTLDLWYINNWSLGLDIQIILRTAFELVRQRNAY